MRRLDLFPPTLAKAHARIAAVRPGDYARSRNALDGAVSGLSPCITHGFVDLPGVAAGVTAGHRLEPQHRFMFEPGWREFFRHVWQHRGEGTLRSLREGPPPDDACARELPASTSRVEPRLGAEAPAELRLKAPDATAVTCRDVWLVHPWSSGNVPAALPAYTVMNGVFLADLHRAWPSTRCPRDD